MIMGALLEITNNWNQPRYSSVGEWINQLWCTHIAVYTDVSLDMEEGGRETEVMRYETDNPFLLILRMDIGDYKPMSAGKEKARKWILPRNSRN